MLKPLVRTLVAFYHQQRLLLTFILLIYLNDEKNFDNVILLTMFLRLLSHKNHVNAKICSFFFIDGIAFFSV